MQAGTDIRGVVDLQAAFLSGWIQVREVANRKDVQSLEALLDPGESEAIVLAREIPADLLLLDDRRARREAERQGVPLTGTIGILREARDRELIPAVTPLLIELRRLGFRSSEALLERIQREEMNG